MDLVALAQHLEHLQRGTDNGGGQRIAEQIGARTLAQQIDNLLSACGETAQGSAEALAQRAGVDVHTAVGAEELAHAVSRLANDSCAVALVDHDKGIVFLGQVADLIHRGDVAVHRENAVGHDDAETLCLCLLQTFLQLSHVGIGIAVALGLAQPHAVDDGGMVQRVADDGVLLGEQRLEHAAVGIEASGIENGVLGLEILADGLFQLLVDVLRATDKPHTRHAEASAVHHPL